MSFSFNELSAVPYRKIVEGHRTQDDPEMDLDMDLSDVTDLSDRALDKRELAFFPPSPTDRSVRSFSSPGELAGFGASGDDVGG